MPNKTPPLKQRTLGVRLDAEMTAWLDDFERTTGVEGVSLARGLLTAAKRFHHEHGYLAFPLKVVPIAQTTAKTKAVTASLLAEDTATYKSAKSA